jgi:DNA-binding PadR family transcriptional regulator
MAKTSNAGPGMTPAAHHILLALLRGELHGYAIMQEVERLTEGSMRLGPGTLYTTLPKLLESGLVVESAHRLAEGEDERRRYSRRSDQGREAVLEETRRLQRLVRYAGRHARIAA